MDKSLERLLAVTHDHDDGHAHTHTPEGEVLTVSETVSSAASVYEMIRNTLEYDESHLLRRNAIRRILRRRIGEDKPEVLARFILRELIWARYLPNKKIPEHTVTTLAGVLQKYRPFFQCVEQTMKGSRQAHDWLLDVLSVEMEYTLVPPKHEEALAGFAYSHLKAHTNWINSPVPEDQQDLLLFVAVHRMILHSNQATLRFRLLTLYEPEWMTYQADDERTKATCLRFPALLQSIEQAIRHPHSHIIARFVRKYAIVFRTIADASHDRDAFVTAIENQDKATIDDLLTHALDDRYSHFRSHLKSSVIRAVLFLLITKMLLAIILELPYEQFVLRTSDWRPLAINILFHPSLLGVIGMSVSLPTKRNTEKVLDLAHRFLGLTPQEQLPFVFPKPHFGALKALFTGGYVLCFCFSIVAIISVLLQIGFHTISIAFFLFFLSLVMFFGLKIRFTKKELIIVEDNIGWLSWFIDMLFLPIIRVGRWIALRAPRVNIFLFFFDFILEAPFKALIAVVEGWQRYLHEKKEEIE